MRVVVGLIAGLGCAACGVDEKKHEGCDPAVVDVVSFDPGSGAGFGAALLPGIVQGLPTGDSDSQGSFDVVSLGEGGSITLEMGCPINDGEGVDFVVYENAFFIALPGEDNELTEPLVFGEPAEVSVSVDGEEFVAFACTPNRQRDDGVNGCAGGAPVLANARNGLTGTPEGGGDGFDLAGLDVDDDLLSDGFGFVRIIDRGPGGAGDNVGFDLDAIAVVR